MSSEEYNPEVFGKAVELGTRMVQLAGGWKQAARSFRTVWTEIHGNHLEGLEDPELDGLLDADLLAFLRQSAEDGVRARHDMPAVRWRAPPGTRSPQAPLLGAMATGPV